MEAASKKMKAEDLSGQKFNYWTVIKRVENTAANKVAFLCECVCGIQKSVVGANLKNNTSTNCGCKSFDERILNKVTHLPEYNIWKSMKGRCLNESASYYKHYGGRGITVCERWLNSFPAFIEDMGMRPSSQHSLERIDNNRGYYKENCEWVTVDVQHRNQRSNVWLEHNGERLIVVDWAKKLGIPPDTLRGRIRCNWPTEKILTTPWRKHQK